MWKIWLAAIVAVTASFITIFLGIINDIRYSVIVYRALLAFVVAGLSVGIGSFIYERFLLKYLLKKVEAASSTQESAEAVNELLTDESAADNAVLPDSAGNEENSDNKKTEFAPFTANNFDHVTTPKS